MIPPNTLRHRYRDKIHVLSLEGLAHPRSNTPVIYGPSRLRWSDSCAPRVCGDTVGAVFCNDGEYVTLRTALLLWDYIEGHRLLVSSLCYGVHVTT